MWRRRREAASAGLSAALYSVYSGLYSEAVVSSVASAVALAEVGYFRETVQYVQRAAKALYEVAGEVFERVKVTVQRLVELFVEAVARALAWVDEHKAYLFLMAAVAAGVVALSAALNMWGLVELERLAYAASLTPFIPAGVKEYSREEAFKMLKKASDPYEKFLEIVREAGAGGVKLAEPWESLRMLIDERGLDEKRKKALFYATLALEEVFRPYRQVAEGLMKEMRNVLKVEKVSTVFGELEKYVVDVVRLRDLMREEEETFQKVLKTLKKRLLEYATKHPELRELLKIDELRARELVEAGINSLSEYSDASFGIKAYAALLAYRELAFGVKTAYGVVVKHWLEGARRRGFCITRQKRHTAGRREPAEGALRLLRRLWWRLSAASS